MERPDSRSPMNPPPSSARAPPPGLSESRSTLQAGSLSEPVWPAAVAEMPVKVIRPKSASGRMRVLPSGSSAAGASAIHSALEVSGWLMRSVRVTEAPVVWSLSDAVARVDLQAQLCLGGGHELIPGVVGGLAVDRLRGRPDLLKRL